jgi:peroxidase
LFFSIENNGIDSILCGSLYDYGFARDSNFAHQIHHRLFEATSTYGQLWRNDLVAINICRGREHGIPSYNAFRDFCNLTKAYYFEDFGDSINYEGIRLLQNLYKLVKIYLKKEVCSNFYLEMSMMLIYLLVLIWKIQYLVVL